MRVMPNTGLFWGRHLVPDGVECQSHERCLAGPVSSRNSLVELSMSEQGLRKIACLSVDVEPDLWCPQERIRLLDDDARLDALCSLLRQANVPLTCFIVMKYAARYAQALASLAKEIKAEFAVHSFSHDRQFPASADEARRSWETYCELWNRAPRGYRSPNCLIDTQGLRNLVGQGFLYDSSVTPSVRFDQFGYNNWHLPTKPFFFRSNDRRILEFPIACFGALRIPLVLSYVKLFGLRTVQAASKFLSLPSVAVVYFHPYDLYVGELANEGRGWKKYAHLRNARNGLRILDGMIAMLKERGYEFMLMEDAAAELMPNDLPQLSSLSA
jgi:peptidoglycan/xylan/chitin deacetylase (PgdA/CDA1 family)